MEIIKQGKLPNEKVYQATCSHCLTQFSFVESEAEKTVKYPPFSRRNPIQGYPVLEAICPLKGCNHIVEVVL